MMKSSYRAMHAYACRRCKACQAEGRPSKTSLLLSLIVVILDAKLRYFVPEHMVSASAYFYICIFVVPSLGHQQHWTPVVGVQC